MQSLAYHLSNSGTAWICGLVRISGLFRVSAVVSKRISKVVSKSARLVLVAAQQLVSQFHKFHFPSTLAVLESLKPDICVWNRSPNSAVSDFKHQGVRTMCKTITILFLLMCMPAIFAADAEAAAIAKRKAASAPSNTLWQAEYVTSNVSFRGAEQSQYVTSYSNLRNWQQCGPSRPRNNPLPLLARVKRKAQSSVQARPQKRGAVASSRSARAHRLVAVPVATYAPVRLSARF